MGHDEKQKVQVQMRVRCTEDEFAASEVLLERLKKVFGIGTLSRSQMYQMGIHLLTQWLDLMEVESGSALAGLRPELPEGYVDDGN